MSLRLRASGRNREQNRRWREALELADPLQLTSFVPTCERGQLPTRVSERGETTVCLEVSAELFWNNVPVGDDNELRSVVIPAANEEDPSILGNIEWEALAHRSFK